MLAALAAALLQADTARADSAAERARRDSAAARPRTTVVPGIGYAPETGVALSPAVVRFWRARAPGARDTVTRPSSLQAAALASTRGQLSLGVQLERWSAGNRTWLAAAAEVSRVPQPFFGVGPVAPLSAEELFTPQVAAVNVTAQAALWRALPSLYVGGQLDASDLAMRRTADGGQLAAGLLPGSRGSRAVGLGPVATLDTRDDIIYTGRGGFLQGLTAVYPQALGSTFGFARWTADARYFVTLGDQRPAAPGRLPRTVLAAQLTLDGTGGTAPFDQLPTFGGEAQKRGYLRGRYRDRAMATAQLELRRAFPGFAPPWLPRIARGRLGGALFAAAGDVAPRWGAMRAAAVNVTAGAGARWLLLPRERLNVRVDYGVSRDSRGLYFTLGEAF